MVHRVLAILFLGGWIVTAYQVAADDRDFGEDVKFLSQHVKTIVLGDSREGPGVAVVAAYQGRVMTSTASGDRGTSYGWINYPLIESGKRVPQINVYGGEERFWLGPEGGQFSIFFPPGAKFDFAQWQTPAVIDTAAFEVVGSSAEKASFRHEATLTNYAGTDFQIRIERDVQLLSDAAIRQALDLGSAPFTAVAYRTSNRLTNVGNADWSKQTGLLSIWLLGMYKHGPKTTVVIPCKMGEEAKLGPVVNDDYFGKVPPARLRVANGAIFFSADGRYRSKIGLSPRRSTPLCGSYDAARGVLTILKYNQPGEEVTDYVNSKWELQEQPYAGDVINAYNDGPAEPGAQPLGPFYELETSSPGLPLKRGQTGEHIQTTFHFEGDAENLDPLARTLLGVSLAQIESALQAEVGE
jgi:hypothetical protein